MGLDGAWWRALELAWESFAARTTPVGAVVVDAGGQIVGEGRGRRYEAAGAEAAGARGTGAEGTGLAHCHIAHAEVNALATLPPERHYEDHTLLTTLEPCCMCVGAAVQATLARVRYAGRDPYAGAAGMVIDTPQARRRQLTVTGPLAGAPGRFAELLHVRWLLDFGAHGAVMAEQRRGIPDIYQQAQHPAVASLLSRPGAELADTLAAYERFAAAPAGD